jgi:FeS assembly protein IscX
MTLRWTDSQEIALALLEAHPEVDPRLIRFTDLHRWVRELAAFADDPSRSNERILEAIQMRWIEELD